jgi:phenylalanyl-tRNA synthetase alpha chain
MSDAPQSLEALKAELEAEIASAGDEAALEAIRVKALGQKGLITLRLRSLGQMDPEQRKIQGPMINALRDHTAGILASAKAVLATKALAARLAQEKVDITLPARGTDYGTIHPVSQVTDEIIEIFAAMGFSLAEGPDIEEDRYNFTMLNFPPGHPAREMHDTFFLDGTAENGERLLLRTHTSPVQVRTLLAQKPPVRVIIPGRTYRCDSDQTHTPMFHQVEGLVIDRNIHMGHLKGTLEAFARAFFEIDHVKMRMRPSHFPFTEPSVEIDIGCKRSGEEIRIGEGDDWLEILGCGMVHPNVIRNCGLDPDQWQGFAFGCGIDRLAMLKYGAPDLRAFFDSDVRWLKHYGFHGLDQPSLGGGLSR